MLKRKTSSVSIRHNVIMGFNIVEEVFHRSTHPLGYLRQRRQYTDDYRYNTCNVRVGPVLELLLFYSNIQHSYLHIEMSQTIRRKMCHI